MWQEFKPTIFFLAKFFGVYLALSWLYGLYIGAFDTQAQPQVDPITREVAQHCTQTGNLLGYEPFVLENDHLNRETPPEQTYDSIWFDGVYAISVEEGCNGINIMILFLAFIIGFGGKLINTVIFIPLGILFIHLANIGRLLLLSLLNVEFEGTAYHFFHKYGFTAVIYAAVLFLWYLWVMRFNGRKPLLKKGAP